MVVIINAFEEHRLKCFPSTRKQKARIFKFLRLGESFRNAPFLCRFCVDSRFLTVEVKLQSWSQMLEKIPPLPPFQCWGKNSCALIALVSPTLNGARGKFPRQYVQGCRF